MEKPRFLIPRYMAGASLAASGEVAGLAAANLLDPDRTMVWRAPGAASAFLDLDLGEEKPCNLVAIANHNLGYGGEFELWAGSRAGEGDLLRAVYPAWEPLWSLDELLIDQHTIDGFLTREELDRYYPAGVLRLLYFETGLVRHLRLILRGPAWASPHNPEGLIQAGVVAAGQYFQADRFVSAPLSLGPQDGSKLSYSEGGQVRRDVGPRYREGQYSFDYSGQGVAMGAWYDLLQELGVGTSFFADFFPGARSQALRLRNQLYGHLTKLELLQLDGSGYGALTLNLRES